MERTTPTGIVILNYNNPDDTLNCIQSIYHYIELNSIRIVIVDNGSKENVLYKLRSEIKKYDKNFEEFKNEQIDNAIKLPTLSLLSLPQNLGYAQGNNKGINLILKDDSIGFILILNNDIILTENFLPELQKKFYHNPSTGIVSPLIYKQDGKTIDHTCARKNHRLTHILLEYSLLFFDILGLLSRIETNRYILKKNPDLIWKDSIEIELPSGSCMLMRKEVVAQINGFDPNTFLFFEENILYHKIDALKLKNYLIPKVSCIHIGAASRKNSPSIFSAKCTIDSLFYYLKTYRKANLLYLIILRLSSTMFLLKIRFKAFIK